MIIYIRHGESTGEGSNPELSDNGRDMAEAAAKWLHRKGYTPMRLVTTTKRRTNETAEIVASHGWFEGWTPEIIQRPGSVRTQPEWEELVALVGDSGAFVGHHPTQHLLERIAGAPAAPKDNRCIVYVVEREGEGWRCVAHWQGRPKAR